MDIVKILKEATNAVSIASAACLEKLEAQGPRFSVHESDLFGNTGKKLGTMLDNCGGAYLTVSGKSAFVSPIKQPLLEKAYQRHGRNIKLCKPCLTEEYGVYILWYNTKDGSTHVIKSAETFEGGTV